MLDFIATIHDSLMDPNRIPIALLALGVVFVVGIVTGPMHNQIGPFIWMITMKMFEGLGNRLDRRERTARDLMTRGLIMTIIVLIFGFLIGSLAQRLVGTYPYMGITEIILLSLCLAGGTLWYILLKLYFSLKTGKSGKGTYLSLSRSTRLDVSSADDFTITRIAMVYACRIFDKGVVAPIFWFLLLGIKGAFIYAVIASLAWFYGKDGFTKGFGRVALALETLMGIVPNMLAGVLIALAGLFTPTGGMTRALLALINNDKRTPYFQGGLTVTALAYSLNVSIGGPCTDITGSALKREWIGPEGATAQLEKGHLRRAMYLILMAYLLFIVSLMSAYIYGQFLF